METRLHAYEIGALSEKEAESFEQHVLECESCLNALKALQPYNEILLLADDTRRDLKKYSDSLLETERDKKTWVHYLWPKAPIFFRPAFTYAIILVLLAVICWPDLTPEQDQLSAVSTTTHQLQILTHTGNRDISQAGLSLSDKRKCLLQFYYAKADKDKHYRVTIEDESGETILAEDNFQIDKNKTGYLLLSRAALTTGVFTLKIYDPLVSTTTSQMEYGFHISP